MNPEPMAPFFDAIVIGEVEELLPSLLDALRNNISEERDRLLDALDALAGVYVPERVAPTPGGRQIERLWVRDMNRSRANARLPAACVHTTDLVPEVGAYTGDTVMIPEHQPSFFGGLRSRA